MTRSARVTKRAFALGAISAAAVLMLSACGSSSSSSAPASGGNNATAYTAQQVPIGDSKKITVTGPIHMAYLAARGNAYLSMVEQTVKSEAAKYPGATVDVFDSGFDGQKQLQQVQNAITSGKYNAFFVNSIGSEGLLCKSLTEDAPAANIAVVNVASPLCAGLPLKPHPADHYAPGTLAIIDNASVDFYIAWYNWVISKNPGPQKVIMMEGPESHTNSAIQNAALAIVTKDHPEFQIIATGHTDWSRVQGQSVMANLLTAHPDVTIVQGVYSDITLGALTAIKRAGVQDNIKVYDRGGSSDILAAIKAGAVQATTLNYAQGSAITAWSIFQKAFTGQPFPNVVLNEGGPVEAGSTTGLTPIDSSNVNQTEPQF